MENPACNTRVLRMRDLTEKVGLRPSTIYELISKNRFPRPFKIVRNGRAAGWLESEIDRWLGARASGEVGHEGQPR